MNLIANHDPLTGIAYGIICQYDMSPEVLNDFEPDYGKPDEAECPECGTVISGDVGEWGDSITCGACGEVFELELPECSEPCAHTYEGDGLVLVLDDSGDVWIFKSPYYTIAEKCSPCAPGAGYLRSDGRKPTSSSMGAPEKTYALPGNFFDDGIAPYPLWSVETDMKVIEEKVDIDCTRCKGLGRIMLAEIAEVSGESVDEVRARMLNDPIPRDVRDLSFKCWACDGKGARSEVKRREIEENV